MAVPGRSEVGRWASLSEFEALRSNASFNDVARKLLETGLKLGDEKASRHLRYKRPTKILARKTTNVEKRESIALESILRCPIVTKHQPTSLRHCSGDLGSRAFCISGFREEVEENVPDC